MAANLNVTDGKVSMMYTGEVPWHGLGTRLAEPPTAAEAIVAAGLDWTTEVEPIQLAADGRAICSHMATVRSDTRQALGIVGTNYKPIHNREAFSFLDSIAGAGTVRYHTAGALGRGERVWMLAKLDGTIRVGRSDDTVDKFLLLSNGHDGGSALRAFWTPIRVVCANTLSAAILNHNARQAQSATPLGVTVRHTGEIVDKIGEAQRILGLAQTYFDGLPPIFDAMAARPMTTLALSNYFKAVYPDPIDPEAERARKNAEEIRSTLTGLFDSGIGHDQPGIKGTLWTAYNAVTEFTDRHKAIRTRSGEAESSRLNSIWWGDSAAIKGKAWKAALELVN